MQNFNALGNIQLGEDYVLFSINPKIHSLSSVKKAALEFTEKACVILDGDPQTEILVELRPFKGSDLTKTAAEFNRLLLKHAPIENVDPKR